MADKKMNRRVGIASLLDRHPVLWILILGVGGVSTIALYMNQVAGDLVETIALENAALYSQAIEEFRTVYTSEVVSTARELGIEVTHDYQDKEHAIPLPATLSMILGKRIGEHEAGAETRLYSAYPFPWREEESQEIFKNPFAREAWEFLTANPERPFYRFEEIGGRRFLRYARADLMRSGCLNCHNTHPDTPRTGWKEGDVRGVLEVQLPLENSIEASRGALHGVILLIVVITGLGLTGTWLFIGRIRRTQAELVKGITKREEVQDALRKSEERLLLAQKVAHLGSYERNLQTGAGWWSDEVYRILGVSRQECEPNFDTYLSCVHPEDLERVKALSSRGSERASINRSDCRIIRPGGEIRTVYNQVKTFTDESGTPIRRVGTILDITERKQAEMKVQEVQDQLRALNRQLITSREMNRRRLALELHDDVGQNLALLSIEIDLFIQKAPESQAKGLKKLAMRTSEISSRVRNLSHRLHPSSLEHLGLVTASKILCNEVSESSGIQIDFNHTGVPSPISPDISICLYRILQESLTNIVKYSEVQAAQVELAGNPDKLMLRISDSGVGIDPESVGRDGGLGFLGMRERLSLVGGELLIESPTSGGTRITAHVPLNSSASPD